MARPGSGFGNLRVPVKVAVAFAVLVASIVAVSAVSLLNLSDLRRADAATERAHRVIAATEGVRFALTRQENSMRGYLLSGQDYYLDRITHLHRPLFEARVRELRRLGVGDPAALGRIDRLERRFQAWRWQASEPALALASDPSRRRDAFAMIGRDSVADRLMGDIETVVEEIETANQAALAREAAVKDRAAAAMKRALILGPLAILAVAAAMGLLLSRSMAAPIVALTGVMRRMAAGDLEARPPATWRSDEIGDMARALTSFRDAAIAKARLEREAEASQIRAEALMIEAQSANRAKSEFLATMTHELRTPLNGILGMAQIMAADALSAKQRERLETIRESGRALLAIINDVLDISKVEAGRMEITPAPFDLGQFAEALAALYRPLAADKGLDFTLTLAPGARGWFRGDAVRLRQVASNLLSNALKFTDRGAITAGLDVVDGRLIFTVSDTGVGVPADRQERLFERFVQADGSATRRFGGTGLGLTLCREIVGLMGGTIDFVSQPGEGSRFVFEVPLPAATAPGAPEPADEVPMIAPDEDSPRVLVADDNAINRTVLQALLGQFGILSETVNDGAEAVSAWESGHWDVILMDVHMPRMDGISATLKIRELEKARGLPRTPIIAVTASVLSHEMEGYFSAGMDGCVPKPIEARTMLDTIRKALVEQS